ncbi:MAG TPA: response regulator, partial [Thermoanaerobaculia bacterium]
SSTKLDQETVPTTRILVIDDDQLIRNTIERALVDDETTVDTASDGLDGIRLLRTNDYAVVLLDLMMPSLSGFAVIEFLQHEQPAKLERVIVMTSRKLDDTNRVVNVDFTGRLLRKPFKEKDLKAMVARRLKKTASFERR